VQTGIHIRNKHCHSLLDRESRKKPYFQYSTLEKKTKQNNNNLITSFVLDEEKGK